MLVQNGRCGGKGQVGEFDEAGLFRDAGSPDAPAMERRRSRGSRGHHFADRLGFHDAFMGEHLTDACENVTNSMIFLASSDPGNEADQAGDRHVKPVAHASGADCRAGGDVRSSGSEGRFILGVSPGVLTSDAEALGYLTGSQQDVCRGDRYDSRHLGGRPALQYRLSDNRYKVSTARTMALTRVGYMGKPYQKPRPEIVGHVVAPYSPGWC